MVWPPRRQLAVAYTPATVHNAMNSIPPSQPPRTASPCRKVNAPAVTNHSARTGKKSYISASRRHPTSAGLRAGGGVGRWHRHRIQATSAPSRRLVWRHGHRRGPPPIRPVPAAPGRGGCAGDRAFHRRDLGRTWPGGGIAGSLSQRPAGTRTLGARQARGGSGHAIEAGSTHVVRLPRDAHQRPATRRAATRGCCRRCARSMRMRMRRGDCARTIRPRCCSHPACRARCRRRCPRARSKPCWPRPTSPRAKACATARCWN